MDKISAGETVAVPTLPTTTPAARLANSAARLKEFPAANA